MKKRFIRYNLIPVIVLSLLFSGCGSVGLAQDSQFDSQFANKDEDPVNIYVSFAEGIYKGVDYDLGLLEFYDVSSDEALSFSFDGGMAITDRYQQPMSLAQLEPGDVVNIAYNSELGKAGALVLNPSAFTYRDVTGYSVGNNGKTVSIGEEVYDVENVKVFSYGNEITLNQLVNYDTLTVQGEDHRIYSIRVDDGHGYLELENEEALVGGWIEIGQAVISQVMDNMLFTVPEGKYTVKLTNEGIEEYRDVNIVRNMISKLDLKDVVSTLPQKGIVSFSINPPDAEVFVDKGRINPGMSVKLPLGIHEITAQRDGFATVSSFFNVDGLNKTVEIDLEKETVLDTVSGNSLDKNMYATITVEAPYDCELYEDNIYKGLTPVTYKKEAGTHTLTLKKEGYVTTSYTVYIEEDGLDQTFSFAELSEEVLISPSPSPSDGTVSGNSLTPSPSATASTTPTSTPDGWFIPLSDATEAPMPTDKPEVNATSVPSQKPTPLSEDRVMPLEEDGLYIDSQDELLGSK